MAGWSSTCPTSPRGGRLRYLAFAAWKAAATARRDLPREYAGPADERVGMPGAITCHPPSDVLLGS